MRAVAAIVAGLVFAAPAWAVTEPQPIQGKDSTIRSVEYDPNALVLIKVAIGSAVQVILPADTVKAPVSVAQAAWRYSSAANTVVFAPNPGATTMVGHIVAIMPDGTKLLHHLLLTVAQETPSAMVASADGSVPQPSPVMGYSSVEFTYGKANEAAKARAATEARKAAVQAAVARRAAFQQSGPPVVRSTASVPERRRCDFMWRGDASLLPQAACDGGTMTRFLWAGQVPVPAILTVDAAGHEHPVTQAPDPNRHGLIIVPAISQRWILRSGSGVVAELFNAAYDPLWNDPVPGADVQPRSVVTVRR